MKSYGYEPRRWWVDPVLVILGALVIMAILSLAARGQVRDAYHLVTQEALDACRASSEKPDVLLGAVYREASGKAHFRFPKTLGHAVILGVVELPPNPTPPYGAEYGLLWPFMPDPRIEAMPKLGTPFGTWRLKAPIRNLWWADADVTELPLPAGVAYAVQPVFVSWGTPTTLRVGVPLLLE